MPSSRLAETYLKTKPKTAHGRETLSKICDSAEELFKVKNYYSTTINDIVQTANVSIGAFYIYFSDKLSLYKYIILQYGHKLRKYIAIGLSSMELPTRYEVEREGFKLFFNFCSENSAIFHLIWQSLFIAPEMFIAYYDDFCKQYEKQLSQAVRVGEVYPMNLEVLSYVLMGTTNFLAMKYVVFSPPSGLTEEQMNRVIDEVMLMLKRGMFMDKPSEDE